MCPADSSRSVTPWCATRRWCIELDESRIARPTCFGSGLAVVNEFTCECLGLMANTSLPGLRICREFDRIVERRGCRPAMIVSDSGTVPPAREILRGREKRSVPRHTVSPTKPQQNGLVESFSGRFRDGDFAHPN